MREIQVRAGTIHYHDTGGDEPVLVFLHGLQMDHTLWDQVVPSMDTKYRCVRLILPLGSHRTPMNEEADLSLLGLTSLVADFLDELDLRHVTLVVSDWGGGMLLTHLGRDSRVARLIICPSEAFDNYPPGLPGKIAASAARMPGGIALALRQLRIRCSAGRHCCLDGWRSDPWTTHSSKRGPHVRRDLRNTQANGLRSASSL